MAGTHVRRRQAGTAAVSRATKVALALGGIAISAAAAPGAAAQGLPPAFQAWIAALQQQGYTVTQGSSLEFTPQYCIQRFLLTFNSCLGASSSDPYVMLEPPIGGGYQDPYYASAGAGTTPQGVQTNLSYQLGSNEAVLAVVTLPPEGAYFSYQSYEFTRPIDRYSHWDYTRSPDPSRALLFASINNSIDDVTIKAQSGLTFGGGTVGFITTANQAVATGMTSSFTGSANALFVEQMGTNLDIGLGPAYDEFMTVVRYSVPYDPMAGAQWLSSVAANVIVYRIDAPSSVGTSLYPQSPLATKYYNQNESTHTSSLAQLTQLLKGWLEQHESHAIVSAPADSSERVNRQGVVIGGLAGPFCIAQGTYCTGDEQDSDAYKIAKIGILSGTNIAMIAGVDHTVTNNATDISAAIEDETTGLRTATAEQANQVAAGFPSPVGTMTGSAAQVLQDLGLYSQASPQLIADLPNLYVTLFARSCNSSELNCNASYLKLIPTLSGSSGTDKLDVVERAYVLPGYANGANPGALLNPEVIY